MTAFIQLKIKQTNHITKIESATLQKIRDQFLEMLTQPEFTCSKLTIETLEQGVKYVKR